MGKLLMGSNTTKTKSEQTPWAPQGAQLTHAFGAAQNIFDSKVGTPWYQGDLHAGLDPLTQQGIEGVGGYAAGAGAAAAGNVANSANPLLGAGALAMDGYGNLASMAGQDPTRQNITNAGLYADNPYLDGQIDAAARDVTRNLRENELPGIDRAATGTGNVNSSRAGVAEGIATRGAQDQIGDISAAMRGAAYDRGLLLSENARGTNMNATGAAASGMNSVYGQGLQGSGQGMDMAYRNLQAMVSAGQISQADAQGMMDSEFARWQGGDTRDSDLLARYYGIVGANNWGGTTNTTQKGPTPGLLQMAAGGLATYVGAGGKF